MSKLYPHFCGACGTRLVLEGKSSVFVCLSCGNAYDYDYFPEDSMVDEAEENLRLGDFDSARMSYSYLLYKEPNNALALRGHLLCDLGARFTSNLIAEDYVFKPGILYNFYIEESPLQYRNYFADIKYLRDLKDKRKRLEEKLVTSEKNMAQISDVLEPYQARANGGWIDEEVGKTKSGASVTQLLLLVVATTILILALLALIAHVPKILGDVVDFKDLAIVIDASIISIAVIAYYIGSFVAGVSGTAEAKYIINHNSKSYNRAELTLADVEESLEETKRLQKIVMNRACDMERRILIHYGLFEKLNEPGEPGEEELES